VGFGGGTKYEKHIFGHNFRNTRLNYITTWLAERSSNLSLGRDGSI
jgi:hypothetical protein